MQITHIQGWQIVCDDHAKTNEHVKNEMSKTHGLAIVNQSLFLREGKYYGIYNEFKRNSWT